jgi:diketogulonate reductase-like aldo/keto reductase
MPEVQGVPVPAFLYGTAWKEERTAALTALALRTGFRGIDTANQRRHYFEAAVGEAVARAIGDGLVTREALFLQTKFTSVDGQDHRLPYDASAPPAEQVRQSFDSSLQHLRTSYVDSLVLHGPSRPRGLGDEDWQVWQAMEALQREGRARVIGASNVAPDQVAALFSHASVKPAFVQNRCFARLGWDRDVRAFCVQRRIVYQGFSLLTANPEVLHHPLVRRIAAREGATPAQVVFAFARAVGMLPLTGTTDPEHMRQDLASRDLRLDPDEVRQIEAVSGGAL